MDVIALTIKTQEKVGVLHDIAEKLYDKNINVLYAHLFLDDRSYGRYYMEIGGVKNTENLIAYISSIPDVISVKTHRLLSEVYGKRVIVVGDGELMAKALQGGVMEAEKHNLNGETISVDGMIIGGGSEIKEALSGLDELPRIHALVLSGSMMGGKITEEIAKLKKYNKDLVIVSLDMLGDLGTVVDLVINDPIQAGSMAVKLISDKDSYNAELLDHTFINK